MKELLFNVDTNTTGIFNRNPHLVAVLPLHISKIIGDSHVYISEFIIAKVKGKIRELTGHPKITDEIFIKLPESLVNPHKILLDIRKKYKKDYIFINLDPLHQIIVEIERKPSGLTEISSIFDTTFEELKRLEDKLPTVFSSGETPDSRIHASP